MSNEEWFPLIDEQGKVIGKMNPSPYELKELLELQNEQKG